MSDRESESAGIQEAKDTVNEARSSLRLFLVNGYADLRRKLVARLGSSELAEDVLQETYLRLDNNLDGPNVANPRAYILRAATNLATDKRRAARRLLAMAEINDLLDVDDGKPTPATIAESRDEMDQFKKVLAELPERRREILLASRVDETPHREIAARFKVSTRTIEIELKQALEYCAGRMGRKLVQRFGRGAGQSSSPISSLNVKSLDHE